MLPQEGKLRISQTKHDEPAVVDAARGIAPVFIVKTLGPPRLDRMNATNEWIACRLREARASGGKVGVVLDVSGRRSRPSPEQQRAMGAWLTTNRELLEQACSAWSMVVTSPVLRGVLTAITWFAPFPCPMKVHASVELGAAWCVESLVAARMSVPSQLRDGAALRAALGSLRFERLP